MTIKIVSEVVVSVYHDDHFTDEQNKVLFLILKRFFQKKI